MSEPFKDIEDARALAQAIVDTVREPLLVLDGDLRVLAVSRSYYLTFRVDRQGRRPSTSLSMRECSWRGFDTSYDMQTKRFQLSESPFGALAKCDASSRNPMKCPLFREVWN